MGMTKAQYAEMAYYYDLLMSDVDYTSWSAYIDDIICKSGAGHKDILEMACGTGSISVNMSEKGYHVTAFDISDDMLSIAHQKAVDRGADIAFLSQDMTDIKINGLFGNVLCLCDSVNYITSAEDLGWMFKWVASHLKKGGVFIFDINSSYKLKNIIGNNTFTFNEDNLAYIWDNYMNDDNTVEFYLTFFVKQDELYRRFDEVHIQRVYENKEIISLLKAAGFERIQMLDAFTFNEPNPCSERVNFVAQFP
jgi:2-polyprenyl-3-methyl-5-hydroxy-6-metoxy-1,4-benzoquinol methylase